MSLDRFKKILWVLSLVVLFSLVFLQTKTTKANYNTDTQCSFMDDTSYENVNAGGGYYQTFYPRENRLTSAVLKLAAFQTDSTATLKIMSSDDSVLATQSITVTGASPVSPTDYSFGDFSAITVTPGQMYKLVLIRSTGNTLYWYKSTICTIQGNVYADGTSRPGADYVFTTYGYTVTAPGTSADEGSASIAAPTKVKAEFMSDTNKIKISWTKSVTEDISGYRVYRSESKTEGFTRISQTDSKTYEYLDTVFEPSKTYYYYVKAYKDLDEGAKSNIAEVIVPETAVKKVVTPVASASAKTGANWWLYTLIAVDLLFIGFFILYELKLKKIWAQKRKENNGSKA